MDALAPFRIPLSALKADSASFEWGIGTDFFGLFDDEHQPPDGMFTVGLEMEHTGGITVLDFLIDGKLRTHCDRCTAPIDLPIESEAQVLVKFGNPAESTDEVIVLDPEAPELNVGKIIYDFILLSIPIRHLVEGCETMDPMPCDTSITRYLSSTNEQSSTPETDNPLWDDLKKAMDN
jgi:uncharacterized metal-binding protein YceD (DUF177 family)